MLPDIRPCCQISGYISRYSAVLPDIRPYCQYIRPYCQIIGHIVTDNDSVWSEECETFQNMIHEVGGIEVEYTEPGTKNKNPRAEGMNKIVEAGIQSLLYENNLPPSWWQRAANDVINVPG